jgi:hypothetical protein
MKTKLIPTLLLSFLMLNLTSCGDIIEQLMNYQPNKPPVIGGVTSSLVEGTPLVPDMKIDLTIDAYDPEDETVAYSFQSDDGAIKNLTTTPTGCTLQFFTDGSIEPGAAVILKITATDPRKAKSSVEYNVGLGKMGPTVTVDGNFPEMIEMEESITGTLSADSDGFYQIRIIDDVSEEIAFDRTAASYFYEKDTDVDFTIYGPGYSNEFTPQLLIPAKSPDKIAIIVKDTLGLEGYAEFSVSVNGPDYVDDEPPYVGLIYPLNRTKLYGDTEIIAEAYDENGIARVDFYIDDRLVGTDTTEPYSTVFDFRSVTVGEHKVKALAYDSVGNSQHHILPNIQVLEVPLQYGEGEDGTIIIHSGTHKISDIYEKLDDPVNIGVETKNGMNKGLNYPSGSFAPEQGNYIKAVNFIIKQNAILTNEAYGDGSDNNKGIIWIACTGYFHNEGLIDLTGKGFQGVGSGANGTNPGLNGFGAGSGYGAEGGHSPTVNGGAGGVIYGESTIRITVWEYLYGSSGGAGGGGKHYAGGGAGGGGHATTGQNGNNGPGDYFSNGNNQSGSGSGAGGGAVRIYAVKFKLLPTTFDNGKIFVNGENAPVTPSSKGGSGGGGSGGTVYIETFDAEIGTNNISSTGGYGGNGNPHGGAGGDGSVGRIAIKVPDGVTITGQTTPNYYNIRDGVYHTP